MIQARSPKFVVIGGGTGSFTVLSGLKRYVSDISAIVNMADDGGSTGILRDELGVLPPGDIRQCLVALSETDQLRDLFNYRFEDGSLSGHTFGNLFLSAVEKMTDSFSDAIDLAGTLLRIKGRVLPITTQKITLKMQLSDGTNVEGEHRIGSYRLGDRQRPELALSPAATINDQAAIAIHEADVVVIAPGNLYGSIAPALIVDGVKDALETTSAKIVYICNLVTKPDQTDDFMVHDFAAEIERFIGANVLDYVIFNTDEPPKSLLKKYTHEGEYIVEFDLDHMHGCHYQANGLPLIDETPVQTSAADKIARHRSLIRHDSDRLARELMRIYFS